MSQKGIGMHRFVLRQNSLAQIDGADDGKANQILQDFKVDADNLPGRAPTPNHGPRREPGNDRTIPQPTDDFANPNGFVDTDASNADQFSDSVDHAVPVHMPDSAAAPMDYGHNSPASQSGSEEDDDGDEEDVKYQQASHDHSRNSEDQRQYWAHQHVRGDSYPRTTTGNPTDADSNDLDGPETSMPIKKEASRRKEDDSMPNPHSNGQTHGLSTNPTPENQGFVYGPAPMRHSQFSMALQGPRAQNAQYVHGPSHQRLPGQQHEGLTSVVNDPSSRAAQAASTNPRTAIAKGKPNTQRRQEVPGQRAKPGHRRHASPHPNQARMTPPPTLLPTNQQKTSHIDRHAENGYRPDPEGSVNPVHHEESNEHALEDALDYNPDDLVEMTYADLQAESFDEDPQRQSDLPADIQQIADLNERLHIASGLTPTEQALFFRSLPLMEWEEAGDWFLERFGEILNKFKEARKEKRTAAMMMEKEIEDRHNVVTKKMKSTESALQDMKKTGGMVLSGTPKKSKRAK
jgi:hypothetical protein